MLEVKESNTILMWIDKLNFVFISFKMKRRHDTNFPKATLF